MVLSLKAWKSRSLPGLPRTECFNPHHDIQNKSPAVFRGAFLFQVREIEQIARAHGLAHLLLDASLTSELFYLSLGYEVRERGEHVLRAGLKMACVKMEKQLG
jgi:hypothetical protein